MNFKIILIGLLLVLFSTQVYAGITPPTTTFSSFQVPNTTDQNITLTCTDNNTGCKGKTMKTGLRATGQYDKVYFLAVQMIAESQQDAESGLMVECFL